MFDTVPQTADEPSEPSLASNGNKGKSTPYLPTCVLEFSMHVDGPPEIVASCDILGIQLFYYDDRNQCYVEKPSDLLWQIPLSKCTNADDLEWVPWPGGWDISHYIQFGYDSLGYVASVWNNPRLAEFVDNPGLLIILLSNTRIFENLSLKGLNRYDLVRMVTGRQHVTLNQVRWLKRVAPGCHPPEVLYPKILNSLLHSANSVESKAGVERRHEIRKLFSHQTQWRIEGLDFAGKLIGHPKANPKDLAWLLSMYNGYEYPEILAAFRNLKELEQTEGLPGIVRSRIRQTLENGFPYTPQIHRQFNICMDACRVHKSKILATFFIHDEDISPAVIRENDFVKSLDTLSKIEKHARLVGNCIYSIPIISQVVSREYDLYAMQGEGLYTFSVDRITLDIRLLEPAKGTLIAFSDLAKIVSWYEEGTTIAR